MPIIKYGTWILLLILSAGLRVDAQRTIYGTVTDDSAEPIVGVNIWAKQMQKGTATDIDGTFQIEVAASDTLLFTYIGYETVELPIADHKQPTEHRQ